MSRGHKSRKLRTIFERDAGCCHYCRVFITLGNGTVDHIIPQHKGGRNANWNLVWACKPCNQKKSNKWPTCQCNLCLHSILEHRRLDLRPTSPVHQYAVADLWGMD
jgi:5-methylcytosine-specific restriction endonuclease McrA